MLTMGHAETRHHRHSKRRLVPEPEKNQWPSKDMLFVCEANLGRSQIAQGIFENATGIKARSAGAAALPERHGNKPHPAVVAEMAAHGIDISNYTVDQLSIDMVTGDTDLIVFCDPKLIPQEIVEKARSVISIPLIDPHGKVTHTQDVIPDIARISDQVDFFIGPPGVNFTKLPVPIEKAVSETFASLEPFIKEELRSIMLGVRNNLYKDKTINGIIYPLMMTKTATVDHQKELPRKIQPWEQLDDYLLEPGKRPSEF